MEEIRMLSGPNEVYISSQESTINFIIYKAIKGDVSELAGGFIFTKDQARELGEWLIQQSK